MRMSKMHDSASKKSNTRLIKFQLWGKPGQQIQHEIWQNFLIDISSSREKVN